jgi:hypothetical protein
MQLFKEDEDLFKEAALLAESREKAGKKSVTSKSPKIPYFLGYMRKKSEVYTLTLTRKEGRKSIPVEVKVETLTGAFILSYFVCLGACIAQQAQQPLTVTFIESLLTREGFNLAEYSHSKVTGASRVAKHVKDLTKQGKISVSVSNKGVISGVTPEMIHAVLTAF